MSNVFIVELSNFT